MAIYPLEPSHLRLGGYRVGKNLAMAYVNPEHAKEGSELSVLLVGKRTKATVEANSLYDPEHALPRGLIYDRKTNA